MPPARPIGSRRVHRGYVLIKVRPGHGIAAWEREHRWVWERAHGPIPPGHTIHHLNGDKSDNRLENLALCSSNSEHFLKYHRELSRQLGHATGSAHWRTMHSPENQLKKALASRGADHSRVAAALRGRPKSEEAKAAFRRAWERRRQRTGPILTPEQAAYIKANSERTTYEALAKQFGVSTGTIKRALAGEYDQVARLKSA